MLSTPTNHHFALRRSVLILLSLCVSVLFLSGCATPNVDLVRQAQDNYNRAAQLDNQSRLFGSYDVQQQDIARQVSINSMYGSVISSLDGLKPEAIQQIQADGLWGNLQTIKAISQWRLGLYAEAALTAEMALTFTQNNLPRDQAINQMMPNLIRNDQARNFVELHHKGSDISHQDWLTQVQEPLAKVLQELPVESKKWQERGRIQIATYLKMNQVIAFVNLRDGFLNLNPCSLAQPDAKAGCEALEQKVTGSAEGNILLTQYADLLLEANEDDCLAKQDPILQRMRRKLGASIPSNLTQACPNE